MKQGIRTIAWCMLFLGTVAGAAAAENTAATQTTLTVATNHAGPRTKATLTAHVSADLAGSPSGVVNFRSGQTDLGSAVLDGEGNASLVTDLLSAGTHQVLAIYQGQSSYQASTSKPEQVHADASTVAGFTVAVTPTSLSTTVGGFVNTVVTVTPVNGFNAYVSLSCSGLPVNTTCNFTPVNILASCTAGTCTPATGSMQIQTQEPSPLIAEFLFPVLLGLAGLGTCKRGAWRNVVLGMLAFAGALGITACSQRYDYLNHGPPGNPGTPAGTYTVTVEAQSSTGSATTTPPTEPQLTLTITVPKS
jgi:hypothetical protein